MEVPFVPQQECQWAAAAVGGGDKAGPGWLERCKFTRELLPCQICPLLLSPLFIHFYTAHSCLLYLHIGKVLVAQCTF